MVSKRDRNRKSPPIVVQCGNPKCGRTVETKEYLVRQDNVEGRPADAVHRAHNPGAGPDFTILCSCGHYTMFVGAARGLRLIE